MADKMKIFAGSASRALTAAICAELKVAPGASSVKRFTEGNTFVQVNETVRGHDVYVVQSVARRPNDDFMELLFWVDALKRASADSVTAVMPYFSYAKGDKKDEPRVSIRARVCADALEAAGVDRVITMDLHSPQIQGFFRVPVDHLYALPELSRAAGRRRDQVVVAPDAGSAKRARRYADYLGATVAVADKTRRGHDEKAEILDLIGDVSGKDALVVDDFTITGLTLCEVARALIARGARTVRVCVTHSLLNEDGLRAVHESPIEEMFTTDTVENGDRLGAGARIQVVPIAAVFAEAIRRIQNRESVSTLFE